MSRRRAVFVLAAILAGLGPHEAWAHAGLRFANPAAGSTLGDTPRVVQLTFWERPEPSLSEIRVLDTRGSTYQIGQPEAVAGAPLALAVHVRPLDRGVYTVSWRTISAIDGHATAGAFAFGVRMKPTGVAWASAPPDPSALELEVLARGVLALGLVLLLGSAAAAAGRFGGDGARDRALGAAGWALGVAGLVLLAAAQRRNAGASYAALLHTAVGRALLGRAAAILVAGGALLAAPSGDSPRRRRAMAAAGLATLGAMAVHSAAGHAAAGGRLVAVAVAVGAQWVHFAAAGIWIGGLAALLAGLTGAPSAEKAQRVRRFSRIAAAGLLAVALTGAWRTFDGISSWRSLIATGYGRTVMAKAALFAAIAALGALNRWRSVPAAAASLGPLRRAGAGELALAAAALGAAALLGALPPPASGFTAATPLEVAGADFGTTVRARLTAASDQPGPNRFVVRAVDYDSGVPVPARRLSLRFTALDDPGVVPTVLPLEPGPGGSWEASGANLAFDGRWRVTVAVERERDSVEVPLELETRTPPPLVSVERVPGRAPQYTVEVRNEGYLRFSLDPERAGPSQLYVTCFDAVGDDRAIEQIVVTAAAGGGPVRAQPVRRLAPDRFVASVELRPGRNTIAAIAHTIDGTRLRAAVEIDIPAP